MDVCSYRQWTTHIRTLKCISFSLLSTTKVILRLNAFFHQLFLSAPYHERGQYTFRKNKSVWRARRRAFKKKQNRRMILFQRFVSRLGILVLCSLQSAIDDDDDDGRAAGSVNIYIKQPERMERSSAGVRREKKWVSITKCNWPNKEHLLGDNDARLLTRSRSNAAQLYGQWNLHNLLVERSPSKEFKFYFYYFSLNYHSELGTRELFSLSTRRSINGGRKREIW